MNLKKLAVGTVILAFLSGCAPTVSQKISTIPVNNQSQEQTMSDRNECEKLAKQKYDKETIGYKQASAAMILMWGPFGLLAVLAGLTSPSMGWTLDSLEDKFEYDFQKCMTKRGYEVTSPKN